MNGASLARSFRFLLLCTTASAALAATQACGEDAGSSYVVDDRGGRTNDVPDAFAAASDGEAPRTTLRLAHLARDLGAVDVCYQAARAGAFEGPILRTGGASPADAAIVDASLDVDLLADASDDDDAGSKALVYGSVSKYFTVAATGTLVIAIVPAGSTSCSGAIASGTVTLDPGKLSTVALFGSDATDAGDAGDGGTSIVALTDDRETKPDKARVRIVNAAAGGPIAVQVVGAQTTTIADAVEPRRASSASSSIPVDALGFATIVPVAPPASLVVVPTGDAGARWQSGPRDLDLRGDSLHTGFVLGAPDAFEVVWCADKNTTGDRTTCTMIR